MMKTTMKWTMTALLAVGASAGCAAGQESEGDSADEDTAESAQAFSVYPTSTEALRSRLDSDVCLHANGGTLGAQVLMSTSCSPTDKNSLWTHEPATDFLVNEVNGLCLDGGGGLYTQTYLNNCDPNNPNVRWERFSYHQLKNLATGYCLDAAGAVAGVGAYLRECDTGNPSLRWHRQSLASTFKSLANTALCMQADGGGLGSAVRMGSACTADNSAAMWVYDSWNGLIVNQVNGLCLDGGGGPYTYTYLNECDPSNPNMTWYLLWEEIVNAGTELCLDANGPAAGARTYLRDCYQSPGLTMQWDVANAEAYRWTAQELNHEIGRADGDGWSASTADDSAGSLTYGPYYTGFNEFVGEAEFTLMVDSTAPNDYCFFDQASGMTLCTATPVATIEVWDQTAQRSLGGKTLYRHSFDAPYQYKAFRTDPGTLKSGHQIEFRVFWYDNTYVRVKDVKLFPDW